MTGRPDMHPETSRPIWLCLGYFVLMLYASTIVGPAGPHFVFRDPAEALQQFLSTRFAATGSDQRADWIGNLLMLGPFGYLVAATVWPRRRPLGLAAFIAALLTCGATILTIKYLQLFFPPRTVTLNYIVAQSAGATMGVAVFALWPGRTGPSVSRGDHIAGLVTLLRLYVVALTIFLLMPLDFALNGEDLWAQAERLPATVSALPGSSRPAAIRAMVTITAAAAFIPVGMLFVFVKAGIHRVGRKIWAVTVLGLVFTTGIFTLSTLVMGASPMVISIPIRTLGILVGALAMRWLVRQDMTLLRQRLRSLLPWLIVPYLLVLLLVNGLLSRYWMSLNEAVSGAYKLGLLPLFDYYIVSKAAAAKNIVGHALLYLPVGAGLWLRDKNPDESKRGGGAFVLAASLSLCIETGRYFRPGLEGDINTVAVAGLSAMLAARLMPALWAMLTTLARQADSAPARGGSSGTRIERNWDKRGSSVTRANRPVPGGEIEEY